MVGCASGLELSLAGSQLDLLHLLDLLDSDLDLDLDWESSPVLAGR